MAKQYPCDSCGEVNCKCGDYISTAPLSEAQKEQVKKYGEEMDKKLAQARKIFFGDMKRG